MGIREFEVDGQTYKYEYDALEGKPDLSMLSQGCYKGFSINVGAGSNGYFHICRITASSGNLNQIIQFTILGREGRWGKYNLKMINSPSAYITGVDFARMIGGTLPVFYVFDSSAHTVDIYSSKGEAYDAQEVLFVKGAYNALIRIDVKNAFVSTLPSGYKAFEVREDYVVDQGATASGWFYRKWASDKIEAWKMMTTTYQISTAIGSAYMTADYASIDAGMFAYIDTVNITPMRTNSALSVSLTSISNTRIDFNVWSPRAESSTQVRTHIYIIGRWK